MSAVFVLAGFVANTRKLGVAASLLLIGWAAYHWRWGHRHRAFFGMQANHETDAGFPFSAASLYPLEEDIGPDHDVLSASGAGGRGRVNAGRMEGPARD